MNWKSTWLLLGLAGLMLAFIFFYERHLQTGPPMPQRLFSFKSVEVTNIQLRLTNQLALRAERVGNTPLWSLTVPIVYPAQPHAIQLLLRTLETSIPQTEIAQKELAASKRTVAEFGLDVPQATLTLQHNGQRTEVLFGSKTPTGTGVYVQVLNQSAIYVLGAELVDLLPRGHTDWRDPMLFSSTGFQMNRIEVRTAGRGFTLDLIDATNQVFLLTKPTVARADPAKVQSFLRDLITSQVTRFITDNPRVDLEAYGLQPPEAELLFLEGTNEQFTVQFGKAPPNDSTNVYARRLATTNIVLVPRSVLELVQVPHSDLRDLHLMGFAPASVDAIEVIGAESFTVRRQTNGSWMITEPKLESADTNAVLDWLKQMAYMEGAVEKEVVTDFSSPYGLSTPPRRYLVKASGTNSAGGATNRILAQLDLGKVSPEKRVYARRPDETTVYSVASSDIARLPYSAWQLRDRQVWSFTTNQVDQVRIRRRLANGVQTRTIRRTGAASWYDGEAELPNSAAIEETIYRVGQLRAAVWVARGEEKKAELGFTETGNRITIELRNGDKPRTLVLEFSTQMLPQAPAPYAAATVDGQTWIFELERPALWYEIVRDLFGPMLLPQ